MEELSINEKKVLLALARIRRKATPKKILENTDLANEDEVANALSWLRFKNLVKINEKVKKLYSLGEEGKKLAENGLPERRVLNLLVKKGQASLKDLKEVLDDYQEPIAIGWLKTRGSAEIEKKGKDIILRLTEKGRLDKDKKLIEEEILSILKDRSWSDIEEEKIRVLKSR